MTVTNLASARRFLTGLLLFVALCAVAALGVFRLSGGISDDAFIHYRYALNLAEGHGWTYNVASKTDHGFTSPLYVLLLALAYLVHPNMQMNATLLFVVSLAGCAALTFGAFSRLGERLTGLIAATLVVTSPALLITRGLESALFLLILAACLYLYLAEAEWLTGATLGLLTLVRGEGALLGLVLGVAWLVLKRRIPTGMIMGGLLILVPWGFYAKVQLGRLLPTTLDAKMAQAASGFWGTGLLFVEGLYTMPIRNGFGVWAMVVATLATVGIAAVVLHRRHRAMVLPVGVFAVAFVLAYGLVLKVPSYDWYYVIPIYALLVLAAVGSGHALETGWTRRDAMNLGLAAFGLASVIVLGIVQTPRHFSYWGYLVTAKWLRENTPSTATVAASEIGVLGWYSGRPIIDYLGLLSPEAAVALKRGDLSWWAYDRAPDYWVAHAPAWRFEIPLLSQDWFSTVFQEVYRTPGIVVYKRVATIPEARLRARQGAPDIFRQAAADIFRQTATMGAFLEGPSGIEAMAALLRVYLIRPDLHGAFGGPERVDLSALLAWAASVGTRGDVSKPELSPYVGTLAMFAEQAARTPPVLVTLDLKLR